jgi:hypothetical protein
MYKQGAKTRPIWDAPEHVIFQLRLTRVAVYKRREKTPGGVFFIKAAIAYRLITCI